MMLKYARIIATMLCILSLSAIAGCDDEGGQSSSSNPPNNSQNNPQDNWNNASGSVWNNQRNVKSGINAGRFSGDGNGKIGKLSGSTFIELAKNPPSNGSPVQVSMQISVEKGSVRASLLTPGGEVISQTASPGTPANLTGNSEVNPDLKVKLESLEENAEQVQYTVNFQGKSAAALNVENFLNNSLAKEIPGIAIQSVNCPADLTFEVGKETPCEVITPQGKFKGVVKTDKIEGNNVSYGFQTLGILNLSLLEKTLQESYKKKENVESTVDCGSSKSPIRIFQKVGEELSCSLSLPNGQKKKAQVVVTSEDAQVKWKFVN